MIRAIDTILRNVLPNVLEDHLFNHLRSVLKENHKLEQILVLLQNAAHSDPDDQLNLDLLSFLDKSR